MSSCVFVHDVVVVVLLVVAAAANLLLVLLFLLVLNGNVDGHSPLHLKLWRGRQTNILNVALFVTLSFVRSLSPPFHCLSLSLLHPLYIHFYFFYFLVVLFVPPGPPSHTLPPSFLLLHSCITAPIRLTSCIQLGLRCRRSCCNQSPGRHLSTLIQ